MQNNKFLKYIVGFVVIVVVVFLLIFSFGQKANGPVVNPQNETDVNQTIVGPISFTIDFGDGSKAKTYTDVPIQATTTVFKALKFVSEKNALELKYKDYGGTLGMFIESIGGVGKDPTGKKWWQYWVNGKYSQVGVSSYVVKPGDQIKFMFTQGQE